MQGQARARALVQAVTTTAAKQAVGQGTDEGGGALVVAARREAQEEGGGQAGRQTWHWFAARRFSSWSTTGGLAYRRPDRCLGCRQ